MTIDDLRAWIAAYERAWRTAGTDVLRDVFTPDATYSPAPYDPVLRGRDAIATFWEAERGRCTMFEEWPFAPGQPRVASDAP